MGNEFTGDYKDAGGDAVPNSMFKKNSMLVGRSDGEPRVLDATGAVEGDGPVIDENGEWIIGPTGGGGGGGGDALVFTADVCATDSSVTKSGLQDFDGITGEDGLVVFTNSRSSAPQRVSSGLWVMHEGDWTRPEGFETGTDVYGAVINIVSGTLWEGTSWVLANTASGVEFQPKIVGTSQLTWLNQYADNNIPVPNSLLYIAESSARPITLGQGELNQVLVSQGAGAAPVWGSAGFSPNVASVQFAASVPSDTNPHALALEELNTDLTSAQGISVDAGNLAFAPGVYVLSLNIDYGTTNTTGTRSYRVNAGVTSLTDSVQADSMAYGFGDNGTIRGTLVFEISSPNIAIEVQQSSGSTTDVIVSGSIVKIA